MTKENLLYFAIGALIGGIGTAVVLKAHYEKQMEETEEHLREGYKALEKAVFSPSEEQEEISEEDIKGTYGDPSERLELSPVQYNKIAKATTEDLMVKEAHPSEDDRPTIYILEDDDDLDRDQHYDQISLSYYVDEDLIIDDKRNTVFDEQSWLDMGILEKFKESDDTYIILRNDDQMIDFDISKEFGEWDG